MSLSRRIFILAGATLLPVIGIQAYNEFDVRRAREKEVRASVVLEAERLADGQQRLFDGIRNVLRALTELHEVRTFDGPACTALFTAIRPTYEGIEALAAAGADGNVFCTSDRNPVRGALPPIPDRFYFRQAMVTGEFTIGHYAYGRQTQTHVLHLSLAFRNQAGEPAGIVFVSLSLDWLASKLNGPNWNQDHAFSLVDFQGTILVRQPDHSRYVGKPFPKDLWSAALAANAPGNYEVPSPLDGVTRIVGFVPPSVGPGGLYVGVGTSRSAAFGKLNETTWRAVAGVVLGALLAICLAGLFGRQLIQKPVAELVDLARRWRAGDLQARSGMRGPTEFGQLGEAFDALAEDLSRAMQHKDVLLREMSHRVMNSLQTISALFSLQSRSVRDPEAKQKFDQAVVRINSIALVYRQMQTTDGVETVDFAAFVRELCKDLQSSVMLNDGQCVVEADPVLLGPNQAMPLALIVNELVTNAVKHGGGPEAGVTVKLGRSSEGCRLAVRNLGTLPAGYRPESTRGFGMRMVISMVAQLEGRLEAASMAGETEFAVTFQPKVPQPMELRVIEGRQQGPSIPT
jgi:two-component sensor histidine kinase